ncbi:hypothetical protein [Microvirga yunnanensis]|nr:hypothetical protein [Microvirga sp. HBU65207]
MTAPIVISATIAIAASTAPGTRVAAATTGIGGIGALHVGTGVVGRL